MADDVHCKYTLVKDLSKIHHMRRLRDLMHVFSSYHLEDIPVPNVYSLIDDGYRAVVCSETNLTTGETIWKSAILFRIVRERRAIWHTVATVDYCIMDPSKKGAFSSMSTSLRMLSQFVARQSKASRLDIVVRLDTQMNATMYLHARRKLLMEGLQDLGDGFSFMKRLRDIDPETGKNRVMAPLPYLDDADVEGMHPLVQSSILPKRRRNGGLLTFVGRVKRSSAEYGRILGFCTDNADWVHPSLNDRVSYMQSVFPPDGGNVKDYVDSLAADAQFLKLTNPKGHVVALMAAIAGYSTPASTPKDSNWIDPERVVFVPLVMCQSGSHGKLTRAGFMQMQELYKELFSILQSDGNKDRYDMVAVMVEEGSVHAGLLRTVGFARTATFLTENGETLSYYAMML